MYAIQTENKLTAKAKGNESKEVCHERDDNEKS